MFCDFGRWIDNRFSVPYSKKTRRVYLSVIDGLIDYAQNLDLSFYAFGLEDLRRFVGWNPETGQPYSPPYQTLRLAAVNLFWAWLFDTGQSPVNLASLLDDEKQKGKKRSPGGVKPHRLPVVLTWKEQSTLFDAINKAAGRTVIRDRAMIAMILGTGLRCEEVCNLPVSALDADYFRVRVIGKGNKERLVDYSHAGEMVSESLCAWLEERTRMLKWLGRDSKFVFVSRSGRQLSEALVYQQTAKYMRSAGLKERLRHVGPHVLRHTASSIMFARGVPVLQVQKNLGHGDLSTTQIYAHLLPKEADF